MTAPPQTQAVQTGSAPGGIGDGGKTITDLIVVTIPAVLLYFIGWVYLYFYLGSFGVSVSELDLDVQTIFIYFLPPVRLLAEFFLEWLLAHWIIVAAVLAIAIAAFIAPATSGLVKRSITAAWGVTSRIFGGLNKLPIILQCVVIFIFLIISGVAATPLIQSASAYAAGKVWAPPSAAIAAIVKTDSEMKSSWLVSYDSCSARRALNLIFADKETYVMLCVDKYDAGSGVVYEVRPENGLISVRMIRRNGWVAPVATGADHAN